MAPLGDISKTLHADLYLAHLLKNHVRGRGCTHKKAFPPRNNLTLGSGFGQVVLAAVAQHWMALQPFG